MFERTRRESKTRDRRTRHPLLADWRYAFNGRRRQVRRDSDSGYVQVDHVKPELVLVVIVILFLSALDAYFTLRLIEAGIVTEANPRSLNNAALPRMSSIR